MSWGGVNHLPSFASFFLCVFPRFSSQKCCIASLGWRRKCIFISARPMKWLKKRTASVWSRKSRRIYAVGPVWTSMALTWAPSLFQRTMAMCVYIYIGIYVCMYVCVYLCMYVSLSFCIYIYIYWSWVVHRQVFICERISCYVGLWGFNDLIYRHFHRPVLPCAYADHHVREPNRGGLRPL